MKRVRGFLYWLLSAGPVGRSVGWFFRHRCFDSNGRVALPQTTTPDIAGAIVFGIYEYPERVLIRRWLPRNFDCIELGSSIGIVSRDILANLMPVNRLVAVEASKPLVDLSIANVSAAGFASRFRAIYGAAHYGADHVAFSENGQHLCGKVVGVSGGTGVSTPCVTLAQLIQANGLQDFSLVMDIEGSEHDLVAKDPHSLINCQAIIAEVHGDGTKRSGFVEALRGQGFALAEVKHAVFAFIRKHAADSSYS